MAKLNFENKQLKFNDASLITKEFPIHSSYSILPKESFEIDEKGNLKKLNDIIKLEKQLTFKKIPEEILKMIHQYFILKDNSISDKNNDFFIAGNFDEKFDVNYCFCMWMDHENSTLIYNDKHKKVAYIKIENYEKLENNKYSLICSKYKIRYIYPS